MVQQSGGKQHIKRNNNDDSIPIFSVVVSLCMLFYKAVSFGAYPILLLHRDIGRGLPHRTTPAWALMRAAVRTTTTPLRRSARLRSDTAVIAGLSSTTTRLTSRSSTATTTSLRLSSFSSSSSLSEKSKKRRKQVSSLPSSKKKKNGDAVASTQKNCLPRNEERRILQSSLESSGAAGAGAAKIRYVVGVDEAGRGPLAGPVVAAAVMIPVDLEGITDSKKITKEAQREALYEEIIASAQVRWGIAVLDAPFIDRVNILQATMRGMTAATTALITGTAVPLENDIVLPHLAAATIDPPSGCYVLSSHTNTNKQKNAKEGSNRPTLDPHDVDQYFALVDGNRLPTDMPCPAQYMIKGDGKEYAIAAASILAKVTRDRLMRDYDKVWPEFGLRQHKGYGTVQHMDAVKTHGATPIHRRTFRPLKDMTFDTDGKVIPG